MGEVKKDASIAAHLLCHRCLVRKIGRLELIWCNECAAKPTQNTKRRAPKYG